MTNVASKSVRGRTRAERLETRVTAEQKRLIERAAALQGRTVTDFVLTSVQDAAQRHDPIHQVEETIFRDLLTIGLSMLRTFLAASGDGDVGPTLTIPGEPVNQMSDSCL